MKKIMLLIVLCLIPSNNQAHQPHLVKSQTIQVENPEVSQAFYATDPACYEIHSQTPFTLYVQILRPKIKELDKNITVVVEHNAQPIASLDGNSAIWSVFHEPFGNDDYYEGPTLTQQAQGTYKIYVRGNGKYVLVIGQKERWPLNVILKTLSTLPKLKIYFERSPLLAYWNLSGAFVATIVLTLCASGYMARLPSKALFKHFKKLWAHKPPLK